MVRHTVNRYHSSVLAILAMERANQCGESGSRQNAVALENISHGQLQALSAVPPDSLSDPDRADGSSGAYVITPPGIIEGRGVVKRFGNSRVHVVPMHAGCAFTLSVTIHISACIFCLYIVYKL